MGLTVLRDCSRTIDAVVIARNGRALSQCGQRAAFIGKIIHHGDSRPVGGAQLPVRIFVDFDRDEVSRRFLIGLHHDRRCSAAGFLMRKAAYLESTVFNFSQRCVPNV